jgi:GNAT superfamily N-acetyltransferase
MATRRRASPPSPPLPPLRVVPATAAVWGDLCALFGAKGACGGCWCQTMRLPTRDYEAGKGAKNRERLRRAVVAGPPPGLLGYLGDDVVGWISLGPREQFAKLATSRVLAPVDARPVWSIVCLVVAKAHRRRGLSSRLLRAAADWAQEPKQDPMPDVFAWTGIAAAFRKAGFVEVARRSPTRPIFRSEA